jgi:nucleoside-diphosphate-sugar epimerase
VALIRPAAAEAKLHFDPPRPGDIPHSLADIGRARDVLGYRPAFDLARGLDQTVPWYGRQARPSTVPAAAASVAVQEAP